MNKLNKETTARFYKNENGYNELEKRWKEYASDPQKRVKLNAYNHMIYQILRGKDWRKMFTPATNSRKLEYQFNNNPYYSAARTFWSIKYAIKFKKNYLAFDASDILVDDINNILNEILHETFTMETAYR